MQRLTTKRNNYNLATPVAAHTNYHGGRPLDCSSFCEVQEDCEKCPIGECFDKLSDYEDEEENGKLLHLPAGIGDMVYSITLQCGAYHPNECITNSSDYCEICKYSIWKVHEDIIKTPQEAENFYFAIHNNPKFFFTDEIKASRKARKYNEKKYQKAFDKWFAHPEKDELDNDEHETNRTE